MYYKEQLIDGIWHYKFSPDGEWFKFNVAKLHEKIENMQSEIDMLRTHNERFLSLLNTNKQD